ncbi:MAG: hypothetical protein LBV73_26330 [Paraburkholderia sp.]|jgi:hypothetical protein|nr:hypothetical protein [Paraburkholderia sp.]
MSADGAFMPGALLELRGLDGRGFDGGPWVRSMFWVKKLHARRLHANHDARKSVNTRA